MLELIFITSNNEKLAHARHLCRDYALTISKQKNYGIGYIEPRIDNREELLSKSVEDAYERFSKTVSPEKRYFFIEDTSVIINSLSKEKEYPGVDVKYWMQNNDFSSIDKMLKEAGNDRTVEVRSDVVLVLPKALQEKYGKIFLSFTSSTKGAIANQEFLIETQPLFPWLNSKTFNRWFIPNGCSKPLSLLEIAEADKYDFRAGAFQQMLSFLKTNEKIKTQNEKEKNALQVELFNTSLFVVCGPPCAGKSILAKHLNDKYNYYHIEASDYMHLSYYERHGINSTVKIADFAEAVLRENPAIVASQIIKNIKNLKNIPIIITGFRSPKEIKCLEEQNSSGLYLEVIYIDADQNTRFQRNQTRVRSDFQASIEGFKAKDEQQYGMGLSEIKKEASNIFFNNSSIEEYFETFEKNYKNKFDNMVDTKNGGIPKNFKSRELQNAIILTLAKKQDQDWYYSTTEISHLIKENPDYSAQPKHKDNISRYFNQNYHPYFEIKGESGRATYRLSQTGKAYAQWLYRNQKK